MRRRKKIKFLKKMLGIAIAIGGAILVIEYIPLWIWYSMLGILCFLFILFVF